MAEAVEVLIEFSLKRRGMQGRLLSWFNKGFCRVPKQQTLNAADCKKMRKCVVSEVPGLGSVCWGAEYSL